MSNENTAETYGSWLVDNPDAGSGRGLLDLEPARVHAGVFEQHRECVRVALLEHPKVDLLGQQDEAPHGLELGLASNCGPGQEGVVHLPSDRVLHLDVLHGRRGRVWNISK